uniref:Uncharacterized protein ycf68 n=1 Tax=Pseudolarix amabilis TaxID=3355 RepID=A0A193PSK5_PSEAD|nr:hypothetical chloroplast RF68 [Pseudolarix amabilis]BAV19348.1 hypothetical chloroplast RF68 [Pseudolarix amabilis]
MAYSSCLFEPGFGTELILRRIDGAIQVRSNADPTFYSFVDLGGPGGAGGYPRILFFSRIHTSLISVWMAISRAQVEVQPRCGKWST